VHRVALAALFVVLAGACADPVTTPTASDASDTLEIRCDGQSTDILTPTVQAQVDGVHVLIHNTSEVRLDVEWPSSGEGADPGDTTRLLGLLPGTSQVRCNLYAENDEQPEGAWASFQVEASPDWISPSVDCPGSMYHGSGSLAPDARGVADPLADASKHFQEEGDQVVQAGYATADERTFVLLQDGEAIAGLVYISDDHGGWIQIESYGCSD
jgi:hypothetical protein